MLSSASANIIMQLDYLQNYAMKGHFFNFKDHARYPMLMLPFLSESKSKIFAFHRTLLASNTFALGCGAHRLVLP